MSYSLLDSVHDEQEIKIVELKYNNSKFSTSAMEDEEYGSSDVDIITLYNIHKTYLLGLEGVPALRGVTTTIKKGEWVIIFGTSGGGKTSLLNIIGTIDTPTKGEITICGTSKHLFLFKNQ
jgi:ABC-type glutathione transport system ATPase component